MIFTIEDYKIIVSNPFLFIIMRISILCLALLTIAVVAQDNEAVIQLLGELRQEAFE